jgi:hypothetical protein
MTSLLAALWVFSLLMGLARRRGRASVVVLPVVLVPLPAPVQDDEAWLRRQLDGLGR